MEIAKHHIFQPGTDPIFVELIEVPTDSNSFIYCTSAESTAAVVGAKVNAVFKFATAEKLEYFAEELAEKPLPDKLIVEGNVAPVTPISLSLAFAFWMSLALKGDLTAQKLVASVLKFTWQGIIDRSLNKRSSELSQPQRITNNHAKEKVTVP